ncbi:hypothetical protein BDA99DRAFT_541779 [Phascolomyces articulosus]|uniref:Uncharacterized protein n=1 Tax=Phascolomyces articulosus TaxID=60185 RepID=A0AAD5JR44_9FUNG|nr:hypothetical protein BDA99DRAFT_541779 [Phascolomyces articulosus]
MIHDHYCKGDEGKNSAINVVIGNLPGCALPALSTDYPCNSSWIKSNDLERSLSSRFITYGNATLKDGKLNVQFWKTITDSNIMKLPFGQGRLDCTGVFAKNGSLEKTVVLILSKPSKEANLPPDVYNEVESYNFEMNCLQIRLVNDYIPLSYT